MADQRTVDFEIDQYASFQTTITWTEDDGTPIDMTGYTVKMDIKTGYDGNLILSLDSADDSITVVEASGQMTFVITPSQTASFNFVRAFFDVVATSPDGFATRVIEGTFLLNKGITDND